MTTFRERMTDPTGLQLYGSSPAEIARWVRESDRPARPIDMDDVRAHVRSLRDRRIISTAEVAEVERLLPEVGPIG